ncbi:hypothetical protein Aperf_G00000060304 [Anoplocephala perfoliata]
MNILIQSLLTTSRRFLASKTNDLPQLERNCWSCLKRISCKTFICECGKVQSVSPHVNYFEVFNLPPKMNIDLHELARRKRTLFQTFHPDKFVRASTEEKRIANTTASFINDACKVLTDPISRAEYILTLNGSECSSEDVPITDPSFLNSILELNEQVDEVTNWIRGDVPNDKIQRHLDEIHHSVSAQWDVELENIGDFINKEDLRRAQESLAKLKYFERVKQRLRDLIPEFIKRGLSIPRE